MWLFNKDVLEDFDKDTENQFHTLEKEEQKFIRKILNKEVSKLIKNLI